MIIPTFSYEQALWHQGFSWVAGIDEVGRGPLAGPVVVAAVVFDATHQPIAGVSDSKLVPATKRKQLSQLIKAQAHSWVISESSVEEINTFGIAPAIRMAMVNAVHKLPQCQHVCIDGLPLKDFPEVPPATFIVKGDQLSYSIAAASIIAKVHRDEQMAVLAQNFPQYGWEKNMGYGTVEHRLAIQQHGITPHHRTLFVRKIK